MGQFIDSINQVAKNYSKYDTWEQQEADKLARKKYLLKNTEVSQEKLEETKERAKTVIRATEIMDARSEDNCEDMEQLTGMIAAVPLIALEATAYPISAVATKKYTDKYDSKIEELNKKHLDEPDINIKEELLNKIKSLEDKKVKTIGKISKITNIGLIVASFFIGAWMILWGTSKQKEASRIGRFQAKQDDLRDIENFVVYTPEQLEKAEEIARSIPDEKEKKNLAKMISELQAISRDKVYYKQWLASKDPDELEKLKQVELSPEELIKAKEDKELVVNVVKEINIKAEEYSENLENAFDTLNAVSWLASFPLGLGINKLLKAFKVNRAVNLVVSITTPLMVDLAIGLSGTTAQKKAARVGRYHARKEMLNNPVTLMNFSDEDMEKAKDVNAPKQKKSFFKKLGQNFKFLVTYHKDNKEYKKYKEIIQKHNERLQKAFKYLDITDEQRAEAEKLQTNVFRAFDEVDEMSQRYSEDVEAGCEIAKQGMSMVWSLGTMAAAALLGRAILKGKFPVVKLTNKFTNWTFDSNSPLKKSINGLYDSLAKDKAVMTDFQRSMVKGELKDFLRKPENAEIKAAVDNLTEEFGKVSQEGIKKLSLEENRDKNASVIISAVFEEHMKKTASAKWMRNMLVQGFKLYSKGKMSKLGIALPKDVQEEMGLNFTYKNYKTLINTGLVAGIPVLGIIFSVPYAFNSWLTNIQKKAGKIGVMEAVNNIDDPRVFA